MFNGYLVMNDPKQRAGVIDLSAPQPSGTNMIDVIAKTISLKDDNHIGFQIFDSTNWSFSEVVLFKDFITE